MSVRLQIDNEQRVFTCLDFVTGSVILHVDGQETISNINVKLEGVARSRLVMPKREWESHDRRSREGKAVIEVHKILYMVQTVFPAQHIRERATSPSGYTLPHGTYEYPFKFRIPVNNLCRPVDSLLQKVSISFDKAQWDYARDPTAHIRTILPPSLYGLPNDAASVRYFLKVTVNRPQFYKLNLRKDKVFVFLPIEPPRPPPSNVETYGRRQHAFNISSLSPPKRSFFKWRSPPPPSGPVLPPRFSIEARLPTPAILTRCERLKLRVILVKKEAFSQCIVLRQLQLRLYSETDVTAHELKKSLVSVIPIFNVNTAFRFGNENTPPGVELEADRSIWERAMVPETVPPTFRTCNMSRSYQLEILLGVSCGMAHGIEQIPIIIPVQIFSGIRPPPDLLKAVTYPHKPITPIAAFQPPSPSSSTYKYSNRSQHYNNPRNILNSLQVPGPSTSAGGGVTNSPVSPISPHSPYQAPTTQMWNQNHHAPFDAPPTYEDAMIEDIAPVEGHMRNVVYPQHEGYFAGISDDDFTRQIPDPARHGRSASFGGGG